MVQSKRLHNTAISLCLLLALSFGAIAQTGIVSSDANGQSETVLKSRSKTLIYVGTGYNFLGSNVKNKTYLNDAIGVNLSLYQPLLVRKAFTFGIQTGAEYGFSMMDYSGALPDPFHVQGETSSTVAFNSNAGSIKQSAFKIEIGPQLNIHLGNHFVISPAFLVGAMILTQSEFSVDQTTIMGGVVGPHHYPLLSKLDITAGALSLTPKLRFHYLINDWIGLWAEVNYTIAPTIKTYLTRFAPEPAPDTAGRYALAQMDHGTTTNEKRIVQYTSIGVNGGIVFSFGRKQGKPLPNGQPVTDGPVVIYKKPKHDTETPGLPPNIAVLPPEIVYPKNYDVITPMNNKYSFSISGLGQCNTDYHMVIKDDKGKVVLDQVYNNKWDGTVSSKNLKKEGGRYSVQVQAIPRMSAGCPYPQKDLGKLKEMQIPVYGNDGKSKPVAFNTQKSMCLPPQDILNVTLDSAVCYKGDTVKVYAHSSVNISGGFSIDAFKLTGVTEMQTGSAANVSIILPYTLSNTTNMNFTFLTTAQCKEIKLAYSAVVSSTSGCSLSFDCHTDSMLLPCCICNYCNTPAGNTISVGSNSITVNNNGTANVIQNFNVNPKRLGKITAELIYDENTVNNEVCRVCQDGTKPNYNFTANDGMVWSGTGNTGANVPADASNSTNQFPSKVITWPCNNSGQVQLTSQIYLPPLATMECCNMSSQICIRYSFTDIDCHTCEEVVCYTIKSTGNNNQ